MICGLATQTFAQCFVELDDAIRAMTPRTVALNAHRAEAPADAIIFQTENIPRQVPDYATRWAGRTIWDFSASNAAKYDAIHVPVGFHPSMQRFRRAKDLDIDVIFSGAINDRRAQILNALQRLGLKVVVVPPRLYGRGRDALLARAKLALNMLFYPDGVFPALRVAHLLANDVPVLSERCAEGWDYVPSVPLDEMVDMAEYLCKSDSARGADAKHAAEQFRASPMVLPS